MRNKCFITLILLVGINTRISAQQVLRDTAGIPAATVQQWKQEFGQNLQAPAALEKIALYTLSFFPELKNRRISIRLREGGAPISTRPVWGSIFRSAAKRKYLVFINAGKENSLFSSVYFRASIPAQIGILGHEFCHISLFNRKNSFGLLGIGISHISKAYMDRFEFFTDSATIAHGLGYYLLEWATLFDSFFEKYAGENPFRNDNTPTGERYMSAATVRKYISKHPGVYPAHPVE